MEGSAIQIYGGVPIFTRTCGRGIPTLLVCPKFYGSVALAWLVSQSSYCERYRGSDGEVAVMVLEPTRSGQLLVRPPGFDDRGTRWSSRAREVHIIREFLWE